MQKSKFSETVFPFILLIISVILTGITGGLVGSAFHFAVEYVTELRTEHSFLVYFLPLAGVIIAALYRLFKKEKNCNTDTVLKAVRENKPLPFVMDILIFISTVLTHLCGGSAGREGAALQLGGSIASKIGTLFRIKEDNIGTLIMCGMSSVFAALFGTPVTACVFALEVSLVGFISYTSLLPCLGSSLVAYGISLLFSIEPVRFTVDVFPQFTLINTGKTVLLALVCAGAGILLCLSLSLAHKYFHKWIKNSFLRAIAGGVIIVLLTLLVGNSDYNGAGMDIVEKAIAGEAVIYAFLLKIIFTSVTAASGFRGGEIVPAFFIGATLGCCAASIIGLPCGFGAALGLICLFCSTVNCPMASIILSVELFGAQGFVLFATGVAVSYITANKFSLYSTQKILRSKQLKKN